MPTVYITAPPEVSEEIATTIVEERLAACVNSVACESVYLWGGEIHEDDEVILLAKTTDDQYPELRERVLEVHPHDVPCIERFDESDVLEAFGQWRSESTESQ